jgi:hypothetical protein
VIKHVNVLAVLAMRLRSRALERILLESELRHAAAGRSREAKVGEEPKPEARPPAPVTAKMGTARAASVYEFTPEGCPVSGFHRLCTEARQGVVPEGECA